VPARGVRIATSLVIFVICAELLGLAASYIDTGALFYTHRKTYPPLLPAPSDRLVLAEAVHPYFGFTHRPGTRFDIPETLRSGAAPATLTTNNFGFVAPVDYPFQKTNPNQVTIGLFGGSVGVWFCQLGAPRLVERLERSSVFRGKELVPLCFSHEGYKQPQEALVLAFFLSLGQSLNLVVNIDGFNDVALASLNNERGMDISMPSVQHLDPLISAVNQSALTPDKLETLAAIFRDRGRLLELQDRIGRNRVASVHFVLDMYYNRLRDQYVRALGRFSTLPSNPTDNAFVQTAPPTRPREGDVYTDIATIWAQSSTLMHELLVARNVPYYHFLQPNQYYGTRTFTDGERTMALNDASPYKHSVEAGYPALVTAGAILRQRGVRFFDATAALDRETEPVYVDDCCHYTVAGNLALADFVAASILGGEPDKVRPTSPR
jgi:hypothetical protein